MKAKRLFVSYSHKDELLRKELDAHLTPLIRESAIEIWHDRRIDAGDEWNEEIDGRMRTAEVFLLLVSPDFFASDYCYGREMSVALDRYNSGDVLIVPIVVRPVDWKRSPLARFQALPKDAIPLTSWDNRDLGWLSVVEGIRNVCEKFKVRHASGRVSSNLKSTPISHVLGGMIDRIEQMYNSDTSLAGLPSGFVDLDRLTHGFHENEVVLVASAPPIDRLGLLLRMVQHIVNNLRLPCALFCARFDPEYIASRLTAATGRIHMQRLRQGRLRDEDWESMTVALGTMHDSPLEMIPAVSATIDDVLISAETLAEKFGALPLVVVDSIDHLAGTKPNTLRKIREYASNRKRTFLIGTGLEVDPAQRNDHRPRVEDLGHWATVNEDFDTLLLLYMDELYRPDTPDLGIAEVIVARSRYPGNIGSVRLTYLRDELAYVNFAEPA